MPVYDVILKSAICVDPFNALHISFTNDWAEEANEVGRRDVGILNILLVKSIENPRLLVAGAFITLFVSVIVVLYVAVELNASLYNVLFKVNEVVEDWVTVLFCAILNVTVIELPFLAYVRFIEAFNN